MFKLNGKNSSDKVFITDCEGPISKNDNAFELANHFIPDGDKLFSILSKFDDVLAEIIRKPDYKKGSTLKFILPFLRAYGATDEKIRKYSLKNVVLVPGAKQTLQFIKNIMPTFIVSTSYEPYIDALCQHLCFSLKNTYSTKMSIDKYPLDQEEINKLRNIRDEIKSFDRIRIPNDARCLEDLPQKSIKTIEKLEKIFWEIIPDLESEKMLDDVNPIGGVEKAKAVEDISEREEVNLEDIIYIGDSITDVEAFRFLGEGGGLSISFNGSVYAVQNAEIAVLAENSIIISILADYFNRFGKEGVFELIDNWSYKTLEKLYPNEKLLSQVSDLYPEELPRVDVINEENERELIEKSIKFRKGLRGEAIGELG